jgi:Lrp/AsnC family transcriptional regulator, leucine-responsive regulatory protein
VQARGLAASAEQKVRDILTAIWGGMPLDLDDLDRRILACLQEDARRSAEVIGAGVGLSASAVQRRIARLREGGVITAEVAIVDPKSLGRSLTLIVDIEVERERPELIAVLKRWIAEEPTIQEAWDVTGESDFVLVVTARDIEEYDALMRKLVHENTNIRRFRTRVALDTLKRGCRVPVNES